MSANAKRFPQGPIVKVDDEGFGYVSLEWQQWFQNPDLVSLEIDTPLPVTSGGTGQDTDLLAILQMAGPMYPATELGAAQASVGISAGIGAPDNAGGANGWFYFRGDGGAMTTIYQKQAGIWTGIL